ncbi:hypothetical protein ACFQL1_15985 [Halomicroarcula sp. GCM10025709]|uniref:hypothetical protein n=1 Tax=Haloarcula TaxID=2237 RepID=UPI0024C2307A|nr:hypothetical protein [Halomicroarcula sp. YJ-61-S]
MASKRAELRPATDPLDLDERDARALTQTMTVLDDIAPAPADAPGLFHVTSGSGRSYVVDLDLGTCECLDYQVRNPPGGCLHIRRVQFETGRREVPGWADISAIDEQFRQYVSAEGEE